MWCNRSDVNSFGVPRVRLCSGAMAAMSLGPFLRHCQNSSVSTALLDGFAGHAGPTEALFDAGLRAAGRACLSGAMEPSGTRSQAVSQRLHLSAHTGRPPHSPSTSSFSTSSHQHHTASLNQFHRAIATHSTLPAQVYQVSTFKAASVLTDLNLFTVGHLYQTSHISILGLQVQHHVCRRSLR